MNASEAEKQLAECDWCCGTGFVQRRLACECCSEPEECHFCQGSGLEKPEDLDQNLSAADHE